MSIDLFFSQPAAKHPSSAIYSDKTGPSGAHGSAGIQGFAESTQRGRDKFLNMLKQVSQDKRTAQQPEHAVASRSTRFTATAANGNIDETSEHELPPIDGFTRSEPGPRPDSMAFEGNLTAFIRLLERLGFINATETAGSQTMADANPADSDPIAAIELLMARIQQLQPGPAADLKVDLEKLQQFIAAALQPADGVSVKGLSPDLANELAQINRWLAGRTPGIQGQNAVSDGLAGPGPGGATVSSAIAAEAEVSAGTAVKSQVTNANLSGLPSIPSSESAAVLSQPDNRGDAAPKLSSDFQTPAAKNDPDSKASPPMEGADADAAKPKAAPGVGPEPQAAKGTVIPGQTATTAEGDHQVRLGMADKPSVKSSASSGPEQAAAKMPESQTQSASVAASLSKDMQETQPGKEGGVKAAFNTAEETVGKVVKTETGNADNGLLNSSSHDLQKAAEPAAVQKESQADQARLRNQTLDQIVHKAAIHFKNGHHEAQIDLKPDFLGHIRMQVISADHQVTVRILAEHGFVKDMIENHLHQLKADLHQQGLEVDKLEVTVSRDSEESGNHKDKLAQSKARSDTAGRQNDDPPAEGKKRQPAAPARDSKATVDYFA